MLSTHLAVIKSNSHKTVDLQYKFLQVGTKNKMLSNLKVRPLERLNKMGTYLSTS